MERLGPKVELPLYNQPSDTSVYQDNRTRHQTCMRVKLISRLRREHADRTSLHRQQSQTYAHLVQEWHRKVERLEAAQKRKSKEAKNREFFEKVFPELRKQREDKERFNRVGARIKSEADLEEIMDGLQEQEVYRRVHTLILILRICSVVVYKASIVYVTPLRKSETKMVTART